ncbi:MAG: hypothetical protein R3F60_11425 [bacterium]
MKGLLRELGRRGWPYVVGLGVMVFFALAENQSRTGEALSDRFDLWAWFKLHLTLPVDYALVEPSGWTAVGTLGALALLHALWPRWWWAPFAFGSMAAWTFWGSVLIGRMA